MAALTAALEKDMKGGTKDSKDSSEKERVERKVVVNVADMPEDLQAKAFELCNAALDKCKDGAINQERDVAQHIKVEFDKSPGPTWHCIFGRNFGAYCTFEASLMLHFTIGQHHCLLFKHG
eukprot:NODE_2591_length_540_cov_71.268765_g2541_i0.p1 GENE.NODE_2591_length_540_cov_71.268765_g2541_i0~~NODE_2591_length_540_cov_71.268765_g2541_i0.p1  ORF type:complete len:121 (+),score=21.75 NODE_2591_length_540_cov_71.268765_g2541_i0:171-533(+)